MTKDKRDTIIIWIIVLAVLGGLAALIVGSVKNKDIRQAEKFQDVVETEITKQLSESGPYTNSGPDAEDSSFFLSGRAESLQALAETDKNATVVWISAPWCEICHVMRPFVWKSVNKYADKVAIVEIDFSDNYHIVQGHQVYGTPTFLVLDRNGNRSFSFSGATQSTFEEHLKRASEL